MFQKKIKYTDDPGKKDQHRFICVNPTIRVIRVQKNHMADITSNFLGIKSPNPYWLASAPPTDKKYNVLRAFEAGWGGVVWKTLGSQVKNVSSRYSAVDFGGQRVMGFNNIELISDRPLNINLKEITECIKLFPDRAMIISLMADK